MNFQCFNGGLCRPKMEATKIVTWMCTYEKRHARYAQEKHFDMSGCPECFGKGESNKTKKWTQVPRSPPEEVRAANGRVNSNIQETQLPSYSLFCPYQNCSLSTLLELPQDIRDESVPKLPTKTQRSQKKKKPAAKAHHLEQVRHISEFLGDIARCTSILF